eukprot:scaffold222232_cov16-Tisochrysis_lutea.AAC.1
MEAVQTKTQAGKHFMHFGCFVPSTTQILRQMFHVGRKKYISRCMPVVAACVRLVAVHISLCARWSPMALHFLLCDKWHH